MTKIKVYTANGLAFIDNITPATKVVLLSDLNDKINSLKEDLPENVNRAGCIILINNHLEVEK